MVFSRESVRCVRHFLNLTDKSTHSSNTHTHTHTRNKNINKINVYSFPRNRYKLFIHRQCDSCIDKNYWIFALYNDIILDDKIFVLSGIIKYNKYLI